MKLALLYRGPLKSCNYGCTYCPFAKGRDSRAELARDKHALERFVAWVASRTEDRLGVFLTPWGEGLVRAHYREALITLSHMSNVDRAVIQTNLSSSTGWVERADPARLALWTTYHPEWTRRATFVAKVRALDDAGVRVSCGVVGFRHFAPDIEALRHELPERVYLWINAVKSGGDEGRGEPYTEADIARFEATDPLFRINTKRHPSLGRSCGAGASVISVDGDGTMRRCHFIPEAIGNLYEPGSFERALVNRPCTNATCGCHIGYVHLDYLELGRVFGSGILERIPSEPVFTPGMRRLAVLANEIRR
jgi:MoaA/NifB/PqqE/SkfB family radical SAM enzyme